MKTAIESSIRTLDVLVLRDFVPIDAENRRTRGYNSALKYELLASLENVDLALRDDIHEAHRCRLRRSLLLPLDPKNQVRQLLSANTRGLHSEDKGNGVHHVRLACGKRDGRVWAKGSA